MKIPGNHNIEKKLIRQLAQGDRNAYRQLYTSHLDSLYRFVLPFVNHEKYEAERIVQDVFVTIWERRKKLDHIRSFENYIFRMAKNRLFDLQKQRQARRTMKADIPTNGVSPSADDDLVYNEYFESAMAIIEELSPQRKRIFLMRTQTEMSISEIADNLKISKSAVKKQLYEAISMVKTRLNQEHGWPLMWWLLGVMVPVWT